MLYDFRKDSVLAPAYDYWEAKRGERAMPQRRDIDPSEIAKLLPYLQITELVEGGTRVRYRLVGTAIVSAYGAELTGKYFDEVYSGARLSFVENNYRILCREQRPILVCNRYVSRKDVDFICNRVVMPLSDDGAAVNQVLTAMSFRFPIGQVGHWGGQWIDHVGDFDFDNASCEVLR